MFEEFEKIEDADLKHFSAMKTGGRARWVVYPKNHLELVKILKICEEKKINHFVLGNGSNVLFSDEGFDGVIISLKHFDKITVCEDESSYENGDAFVKDNIESGTATFVRVGAGVNLFALNLKLQKMGLSGLEWSYGIPATMGGFVVGNGGCFGHEIGEVVEEVVVLDCGKLTSLKKNDLDFSYRHSNLREKIVLSVKLRLGRQNCEKIMQNMQFFIQKKRESQPCDLPSLGSIFKRSTDKKSGEPLIPAKLIDNMGLKGVRIGKAEISTKHAGFIVNTGGATSSDVLALVEIVEERLSQIGVKVEREIVVVKE